MSVTADSSVVTPPREGGITVTAVTAATASSAIAFGSVTRGQYVAIGVDDGSTDSLPVYWLTVGGSDVTAPNPTATSGDGRTMGPYQGVVHVKPRADETHYKVYSTASGYARHCASSNGA